MLFLTNFFILFLLPTTINFILSFSGTLGSILIFIFSFSLIAITFKEYFFSTDHHWKMQGAYKGYEEHWQHLQCQSVAAPTHLQEITLLRLKHT